MPRPELSLQVDRQRAPRIGGLPVAGEVIRRDPAEVYAEKWARAGADHALYTEGTGTEATLLLDAIVARLTTTAERRANPRRGKREPLVIVEAAAGPGDHALHLAKSLPATHVIAVDTSEGAINRINQRKPEHEDQFGVGSRLSVVHGDASEVLAKLDDSGLDGFHANSFLHFLTTKQRAALLEGVAGKLKKRGLAGASFKEYHPDDPLLTDPRTKIIHEDERGVLALPPDCIQRLYVRNPVGVQQEFMDAGLTPVDTFRWGVLGYDVPGKMSYFVGVLAEKAA